MLIYCLIISLLNFIISIFVMVWYGDNNIPDERKIFMFLWVVACFLSTLFLTKMVMV